MVSIHDDFGCHLDLNFQSNLGTSFLHKFVVDLLMDFDSIFDVV